jgi:hypothetical protein
MATIKSYTTVEQSRKLAEILPLESADMKWYFWKSEIDAPKLPTFGYSKDAAENYKSTEAVYLPCWSLAALLGVLPKGYSLGARTNRKYYVCMTHINHNVSEFDNPVDACYEMILKLHELKML